MNKKERAGKAVYLMARLIESHKAEVAILSDFAILSAVDHKWGVIGHCKLSAVGVLDGKGDGLASKPVANVVCVTVIHCYADRVVKNHFEIRDKRVGPVASLLKGVVDVIVGIRIVEINAEGLLNRGEVEILLEVFWGSGIFVWVTNATVLLAGSGISKFRRGTALLIDTTATIHIVRRLDVRSTLIGSLKAILHPNIRGPVDLLTFCNEVKAASNHIASKFHELIHSIVDGLNPVGVVDSEFRIKG